MNGFQQILGQPHAVGLLQRDFVQGKVKHAYLLAGPGGVGKRTVALAFARTLFCLQPTEAGDSCGQCRNCRRSDHGQVPDFQLVQPEGKKTIGIEQIREIGRQLGLKHVEGGPRVILIDRADRMTTDAANCLLKNLEDPPAGTVFILTADEQEMLLSTIVSRCQMIRLKSLEHQAVQQILERQSDLGPEQTRQLAELSSGSVGDVLEKRQQLLEAGPWMDLGALLAEAGVRQEALRLAETLEKVDCLEELLGSWIVDFRNALMASVLPAEERPICRESLEDKGELFLTEGLALLLDMKRKRKQNVNARLALDVMLQRMFDALEDNRGGNHGRR